VEDWKQMELFQQLSPEDSPASISAEPSSTSPQELSSPDQDFGKSIPGSLPKSAPSGSSWRTSHSCDEEGLPQSSAIFGRSATMLSGIVSPLMPLVRLTRGTDSGLQRWPTPTSRDWKDGSAKACRNVDPNCLLGRVVHSRENYQTTGSLTPMFCEWLMGFPIGWTELNNSATP